MDSAAHLDALLRLGLSDDLSAALRHVASLGDAGRAEFLALADSHHVVIRALGRVLDAAPDAHLRAWAAEAIAGEHARIANALRYLDRICEALENANCPVVVMKSLDHWPDLGNDLDLFTTGNEERVVRVMSGRFQARVQPRSWGDRLANKWNFAVPGLKEAVEVHARRLGQTGEHTALARRFITRRVLEHVGGYSFLLPAPEERVIEATLQRMYRHFYFRVCDVVDTAALVNAGALDFAELRSAAAQAGIWPGVATYLKISSDYVERFRGAALPLPPAVLAAARFGGDQVAAGGHFLRVPILPHGAALYTAQVTRTALRGDVPATLRLSLLPPLASAAALAYRLTGSDKGVW